MLPVADFEYLLASAPGWAERRRALLRSVGFLAVALALIGALLFVLKRVLDGRTDFDHPSLKLLFAAELAVALFSVALPTGLLRLFTHEPLALFGWGSPRKLRLLLRGAAGGFCLMGLAMASIAAMGGVHFGGPSLPPLALLGYGFCYVVIFILVAISEEGLLRGYPLIQLSRAVSFWPAAILTSLLFTALHLGHDNETALGLTQVCAFGLLMAVSVRKTGGIWFALGFHAAWDFTETFVFGVPDSGTASAASLIVSQFSGAAWLTGGSAGPEGSLLIFPVLALLAVWLRFGFRHFGPAEG